MTGVSVGSAVWGTDQIGPEPAGRLGPPTGATCDNARARADAGTPSIARGSRNAEHAQSQRVDGDAPDARPRTVETVHPARRQPTDRPIERFTAETIALSEARTMLGSMPTPHSTRSPTAHSTKAAAVASPPELIACSV